MDEVVQLHPKFGYKEKGKNLIASQFVGSVTECFCTDFGKSQVLQAIIICHLAFPSKHLTHLALQKCSIYQMLQNPYIYIYIYRYQMQHHHYS